MLLVLFSGLCRTCEVFGVKEFVLGSLKYVSDPSFVSLSVTAQKWVDIREVKPADLRSYLQQMRLTEGYTLVGAEQTNGSACLTEYKFPEKTLLLLGCVVSTSLTFIQIRAVTDYCCFISVTKRRVFRWS